MIAFKHQANPPIPTVDARPAPDYAGETKGL